MIALSLIGLGLIWILATALAAREEADDIGQRLQVVRELIAQGRVAEARHVAADIPAMSARAHRLTTGPAWWLAAHVPYLGRPAEVIRDLTAVQDDAGGDAVKDLLRVAVVLDPSHLRVAGSQIRLEPFTAARPDLASALRSLHAARRALARIPTTSWLSAANSGRASYQSSVVQLTNYVEAANRAARILPSMLGAHGTQTYFIGLQNEAELRGTGGLPGAFAIATASHGAVRFVRFDSDAVLLPGRTHRIETGLDFGSEYNALYAASDPTASYQDSNVSPNFPYAAQIWADMWQKVSGQRVDGVIAVDPTALAYFLRAVGPVALNGGGEVNAENVVDLTERDQYSLYPDNARRKEFVVSVVRAAATGLTRGTGSPQALVKAASLSAQQRRLLVWSRDPSTEAVLSESTYAGAIPRTSRPFGALILNNAASGKLDYYLRRSMSYSSSGCGSFRDVRVTISLTNSAPATGLPPYVYSRLDGDRPAGAKRGDNRSIVDYFGTRGGSLISAQVDGSFAAVSVQSSLGHPVYRLDLELPRGTTRALQLHLREPSSGQPDVWTQPGVTPVKVEVDAQSCG